MEAALVPLAPQAAVEAASAVVAFSMVVVAQLRKAQRPLASALGFCKPWSKGAKLSKGNKKIEPQRCACNETKRGKLAEVNLVAEVLQCATYLAPHSTA